MIKDLTLINNTVQGKVRSEMYRETTVVINIDEYYEGKNSFPCGDGCDYELSYKEDHIVHDFLSKKKDIFAKIKKVIGK